MLPEFSSEKVSINRVARGKKSLTIGNALEVVVGLGRVEVNTNPLVVDLVLDIAEQDKGRDNTGAAGCLHAGLDVAVPHVPRRGEDGADRLGRHGEQGVVAVQERLALADPVGLVRVAQILADVPVAVERVHLVDLVLAYRGRHA
jgi:hypothetical protein